MKEYLSSFVLQILTKLNEEGGKPVLVGGCVRDYYCRKPFKDIDIEVFHLSFEKVEKILSSLEGVHYVGNSFGVFKARNLNVDISLPRKDNKIAAGHKGFSVQYDPTLSFFEAARRRDLTMNSMGFDIFAPSGQQWLDPFEGRKHIDQKKLCATDSLHFVEDPLRALRVMQFASRFDMDPEDSLIEMCGEFNLEEISSERIFQEFNKWIVSPFPQKGMDFLYKTGLIQYFPGFSELPFSSVKNALERLMKNDARNILEPSLIKKEERVCLSAWILLYYYLPKENKKDFLLRLNFSKMWEKALQESFMFFEFIENNKSKREILKFSRSLKILTMKDVSFFLNCLGHSFYSSLSLWVQHFAFFPPPPVVTAAHLLSKGMSPGRKLGKFLKQCLNYQDETDENDPEIIIAAIESESHDKKI